MSHPQNPAANGTATSSTLADAAVDDSRLLMSIVTVARSIFGAAASSVFLYDRETDELVFEAVSGEGEGSLIGTRFPADRGIAGWVLATGEAMTATDLRDGDMLARDLAESTGYVPDSIMAAPVAHGADTLGVLQVLDPHPQSRASIADLDLLAMFADQAAMSLHILVRNRMARRAVKQRGDGYEKLAGIAALLADMEPDQRAKAVQLIDSMHDMLAMSQSRG